MVVLAKAMLGKSGTTVLLTFLRTIQRVEVGTVENVVYSIRLVRKAYAGIHPFPLPHESRSDQVAAMNPTGVLISEARSNAPTLPPAPTDQVRDPTSLPVFSVTSLYIPFKLANLTQQQHTQADQVKLMEALMAYKTAVKELAQKYPAYGEPNTAITENVKISDFQGDRTYLSVTLVVGVQSVSDVRDTNLVLMREMMLKAKANGLEFTHEI